jgi:hypothetical protein
MLEIAVAFSSLKLYVGGKCNTDGLCNFTTLPEDFF